MYSYAPLADQHIRVLDLLPGSPESEICVRINPVNLNLENPPKYEALSYTWGIPASNHHVFVDTEQDRQIFPVTENLYTALKYLRHPILLREIWADAICIYQSNVPERNEQVARMADIYRAAAKVIVWLGPEANSSNLAIEMLVTTASMIEVEWPHYKITPARIEDAASDWLDLEKHAPFDDQTWLAIVQLLNRPWFTRLWIWQEVFLAHKGAEIVCGTTTMTWYDFRKAILCLWRRRKPDRVQGLHKALSRAWQICSLNDQPSLRTVLRRTKDAQCSDQRDRIYGVLNLVQEQERLGIQPDYGKSLVEVYRGLMVTSIFEHGDMSLLACCELQDERGAMPSWVPNWSVPRRCKEIWGARACWNSLPQAKYNDGDGFLIATGCHSATITKVKHILTAASSNLAQTGKVPQLGETYAAFYDLIAWLRQELHTESSQQIEAICRTLCCNEFSDRYEPIDDKHLSFQKTQERFLALSDRSTEPSKDLLRESAAFLDAFYNNSLGRSFIITDEGYVGLAPDMSRPGDCIAVLLGCQSPIVLCPRPEHSEEYLVLGECYVHSLMTGEAFLGPLPSNWQRVARHSESTQSNWDAFVDRESGVSQVEDPRLGPLPEGWAEEEHSMQHIYIRFRNMKEGWASIYDPRMMLPALRMRGVALQDFHLV